ncbi:uncharacterized protein [Nicotiana tomentosiformis]|uniref:uncharacterized protein n=1 Tax=Nicotiana tomentosiformis TaxID=4098 RepID=UPI00388C8982
MTWAEEVEASVEMATKSSIWDNFDITKVSNAGFKLDFIEPEKHVVCYVLGAHPPFTVLNGYIQRQWAKYGINKVVMLKNGIVLVRFDTELGKNEVIQGGIYHFDNKTFIVKAWSPDMKFIREELCTVPIWVKLPGLDFKYWSPKGLSKIGNLIGKPLMVDQNTEKKMGLNFAILLIEVDIDTNLPEKKFGHVDENCRKKKKSQQESPKKLEEERHNVAEEPKTQG